MSTGKNTFKFLCFVFVFSFIHFHLERLNIILSFIFLAAAILLAANCTGHKKLCKNALNVTAIIAGSFIFACLWVNVEQYVFHLFRSADFRIQPYANIPCLLLSIVAALLLCKLFCFGQGLILPRWAFLALCFIPPFLYLCLGLFLTLIDLPALELLLSKISGMYSGRMVLMYNYDLYRPIKDISMGWSIFCMFKYNQSMRIKKLLEMQAQL